MKVVNMEHKITVKGRNTIQHGKSEKVSLDKKSESRLKSTARTIGKGAAVVGKGAATVKKGIAKVASNRVVRTGGKIVSAVGTAADKAIDNIDNGTVQAAKKSFDILSGSVRLGGKTVKITGKAINKTFKLSRFIAKKIKLKKVKAKQLNKTVDNKRLKKLKLAKRKSVPKKFKVKKSALYRFCESFQTAKKAASFTKKHIIKPVAVTVKKAGSTADTVVEKVTASMDNDAVQFAKKSYDVAKTGAKATVKTAKATGKTIKTTAKVTRTLVTKKGRRKLVKSVKRRVEQVKRNVQRAQKVAKATAKAVKATAKFAVKIVQTAVKAVVKLVSLIIETAPWSLIIIAVIAVVILLAYFVSTAFTEVLSKEHKATGWAMGESDTVSDVYDNVKDLGEQLTDACNDKFANSLKSTITSFCGETEDPQKIIEYNSSVYFPATGKDEQINGKIEDFISGASAYSSKNYSDCVAALAVLITREKSGSDTEDILEKFTKADFERFIGTVNGNSCDFGNTFFIKTTVTTSGETCPNANCKTEYKDDDCCSRENESGETEYYCGGHSYCDNDHEKLSVNLQTVDDYLGKSFSEIYNFDNDEQEQFEAVSDFVSDLLEEMAENSAQEVNSAQ